MDGLICDSYRLNVQGITGYLACFLLLTSLV